MVLPEAIAVNNYLSSFIFKSVYLRFFFYLAIQKKYIITRYNSELKAINLEVNKVKYNKKRNNKLLAFTFTPWWKQTEIPKY